MMPEDPQHKHDEMAHYDNEQNLTKNNQKAKPGKPGRSDKFIYRVGELKRIKEGKRIS